MKYTHKQLARHCGRMKRHFNREKERFQVYPAHAQQLADEAMLEALSNVQLCGWPESDDTETLRGEFAAWDALSDEALANCERPASGD